MRKPPFWATVLTIIGVLILCGLGTWQIKRLSWKQNLLAQIEQEHARDVSRIIIEPSDITADMNMQRGVIYGTFDHDHEIAIAPRTHEGTPGYHILTPLLLQDDSIMIVNRGWVPLDKRAIDTRPESRVSGKTKVTGIFRTPQKPNIFVPQNAPNQGQWYRIDINDIQNHIGKDEIKPVILYAEATDNQNLLPLSSATKPQLNNNHLQYAFFWFSLAVTLIIIYILRFVRTKK